MDEVLKTKACMLTIQSCMMTICGDHLMMMMMSVADASADADAANKVFHYI